MRVRVRLLTAFLLILMPAAALAGIDARMLRMPDVSAEQIAFVYAGDIWVAPKEGGTAQRLSTPAGQEAFPRFSPDGRWVTYVSDESGRDEIYVRPFPGPGGKWQVSSGGGARPRWSSDGSGLVFLRGNHLL